VNRSRNGIFTFVHIGEFGGGLNSAMFLALVSRVTMYRARRKVAAFRRLSAKNDFERKIDNLQTTPPL